MHSSTWATYPTVAILSILLSACATQHRAAVQDDSHDRIAVGTVQKEIHVGMSGAEVAAALGSPNIVSTDEQRREVWIYDKLATDTVRSSSKFGVSGLIFAWATNPGRGVAGGAAPSYEQSAGATSRSQRTLTVIIKFDDQNLVRDFAYHTSRF